MNTITRTSERWAVVGLLLLLATNTGAQDGVSVERSGLGWRERTETTVDMTPGSTFGVVSARGAIEVSTWDRNQVQITVTKKADTFTEAEARELFAAMEVTVTPDGGKVRVVAAPSSQRRLQGLEVQIAARVPVRCSVDLATQGGAIDVADLEGSVIARTAGGSIAVGQLTHGSAQLETAGGSISIKQITGGNGQCATAGGEITVGDVSGNLQLETAGGGITVGRVGGLLHAETSGGRIEIGEGGTGVDAQTAGGGIVVGRSHGPVRVSTTGGSIELGSVTGSVDAQTLGGEVVVAEAGGGIRAETAGGGISLGGAGGPVVARTSGGAITIANARGSVEARTSGGGIRADLILAEPAVDTHCTLETAGGDVALSLPASRAATVDAEIQVEGWRSRDYRITSDAPLQVKGEGTDRVTAQGTLNGGGDLIRLRTTNGAITITTK